MRHESTTANVKNDLMPKDDLNAVKGILIAILLALPVWVVLFLILLAFGFLD